MGVREKRSAPGTMNIGVVAALIIYGLLNSILYASLLPLWEGFDEPFHYSYVAYVRQHHTAPELGKTVLSQEVWNSLHLVPQSWGVKQNLPWAVTFDEFLRMPRSVQAAKRASLERGAFDTNSSPGLNYEAHQAPLAYALLAFADQASSSASLLTRVWRLRLICGVFASAATSAILFVLGSRLGIAASFQGALVFVILSWQMFYATTAHVSNDWLAAPLMALLMERTIALTELSSIRNLLTLSVVMAAGLLAKSYFLALLPLVSVIVVWLRVKRRLSPLGIVAFVAMIATLAGPWYARNLRLYDNLTGMQETRGGVRWLELSVSFFRLPWARSVRSLAYTSVWTGNNSFTTFSIVAISMILLGFAASTWVYVTRLLRARRRLPVAEWILVGACTLYGTALIYSSVVSFWFSKGVVYTASPWYTAPIIPILAVLLFRGLAGSGRPGAWIRLWLVWWSAYIISATYWAKLIPLYAGYPDRRTTLAGLIAWYRSNMSAIVDGLRTTTMVPPGVILGLAALVPAVAIALATLLSLHHRKEVARADS